MGAVFGLGLVLSQNSTFKCLSIFLINIVANQTLQGSCILMLFLAYCRLRALSSGGSVISPPLSPALPKYKLADYRYGREEMLALYVKDNKVSE